MSVYVYVCMSIETGMNKERQSFERASPFSLHAELRERIVYPRVNVKG